MKPGWEARRKSFGILPFLPSRDISVPFPAAPLHFAEGQGLSQLSQLWYTLVMGKALLFQGGWTHGETHTTSATQTAFGPAQFGKESCIAFCRPVSLSLSQLIAFPDALQLRTLGTVKASQETLPKQAAPALQLPTTLSPPKVPVHLP